MKNTYPYLISIVMIVGVVLTANAQQIYTVSQVSDDGTAQPNTLSEAITLANAYTGAESIIEIRFLVDSVALTGVKLPTLDNSAVPKKAIHLKRQNGNSIVQRTSATPFGIFVVDTNNIVVFENLTIRGGDLTTETTNFLRNGAGVRIDSGATVAFERCIIEQNTTTGNVAAAVGVSGGQFSMTNCIVRTNTNTSLSGNAISILQNATATLVNSLVVENIGIGIRSANNLSLSQCVVARNSNSGVVGNPITGTSSASIFNSILAENGVLDMFGDFSFNLNAPKPTRARYSLIQNPDASLIDPFAIEDGYSGLIVGKPANFVNAAAGDYRLAPNSPALERGANDTTGLGFFLPVLLSNTDFDGKTLRGAYREPGAFEMGGEVRLVTSPFNSGMGTLRQTIQDAFPGDTIRFHPSIDSIKLGGTPTLLVQKSLTIENTSQKKIILLDTATVRRTLITALIGDTTIFNSQPVYRYGALSITGIHLTKGGGGVAQAIRAEATVNLTNCLVTEHRGGGEVISVAAGDLSMKNVQIRNNGLSSGSLIVNCRALNGNAPKVKLTNCVIGANFGIGLRFGFCASAELTNCTITNNTDDGIVSLTTIPVLTNTIVAYNANNVVTTAGFTEVNSITTNPSTYPFHSGQSFRLLPTATDLIGQGTLSGAPTADLDGNPRPLPPNTNPSIGAFEARALAPTAQFTLSNLSTPTTFTGTFISMSPSTPVTGDITVLFFDGGRTGDIPTLNGSPYFWVISATAIVLPNITVTIDWNSVPNNFVGNPNTLEVIRREGFGQPWTLLQGLTRNPTNISFITNSFSEFALAGDADNPLPVELLEFRGVSNERGIALSWSTSAEQENLGFEIRRTVQGEDAWVSIASYQNAPELRGRGTTTQLTRYAFEDLTVERGKTYQYRLRSYDFNGTMHEYPAVVSVNSIAIGLGAKRYALAQNYPNPFNPTTVIQYELATRGEVKLELFDVLGRSVSVLVNATQDAGVHTYSLDASRFSLPSGIYFYRLSSGNFTRTMKMMLVK